MLSGRAALSCQRLFDFLHLLPIRLRQPLKQPVRADPKRLADFGKGRDQKGKFAVFNVADRLPVDPHQLGQAFLRDIGAEAGCFHVPADEPEYLTICHPQFETTFVRRLTSNIFDANGLFANVRCGAGNQQEFRNNVMAQESVIRDRNGNRIGSIVDNGHQLVARDKFGNNLGYYDPQRNVTSDRNSNRICEGNALSALIMQAAGV